MLETHGTRSNPAVAWCVALLVAGCDSTEAPAGGSTGGSTSQAGGSASGGVTAQGGVGTGGVAIGGVHGQRHLRAVQ
jgi:hypothetical protein